MNPRLRIFLAIMLPFIACGAQWLLWESYIKPYVWFLFFPAAFFSAWLGGLRCGLASTLISALLVWFVFIPQQISLQMHNLAAGASVVLFIVMGALFAWVFERLKLAKRRTDEALDKINVLYRKTLELDELKNQFFANVSHELRTPLTLIMSPLAQRLAAADLPEAVLRQDEMMLRNARLLYRHVTDLLDAAKLEAGRMSLDYARVNLCELVQSTASQFDSLAREKNFDYRIDVPASLIVEADGEKVQRILLNLLSNVFKFVPDGRRIEVRLCEDKGQAILDIQDNGPGIPANQRETVFERFHQIKNSAQRSYGGTGLGLSIVKEFAELHGGSATVTEAPGGGALFRILLPVLAPPDAVVHDTARSLDPAVERQIKEELRPVERRRTSASDQDSEGDASLVLVVEDNADMNAFIADTLRPHYRVLSAFNGREGLEKALANPPDLILSDVMMPDLDGDQMVVELRKQPSMNNVPIVMLTAKADDSLRVSLFEQGIQGYLNKPFSTVELLARVGGLVASRRRTLGELTRSEAELKEAQRLAGVGSWCTVDLSPDGPAWSEEMYRIFGLTHSLPPPSLLESAKLFTPESWERVAAARAKAVREGCPYVCDVEVVRPDGSSRFVVLRGEPIRDAKGAVIGVRGTAQDITERKRAEDEINRLNIDLERRVVERTKELTSAVNELDSFAYAVSHDLRAPLRAMSGFSQALMEDYGDKLDGEAKVYLDQISFASARMGELINGILVLSRSTRNQMKNETIDISAIARRVLNDLACREPERKVSFLIEPDIHAAGDPRMIEAVMENLLGNSWKYTGKTPDPAIRVFIGEVGKLRGICVADNGAGFDMAHASQLFQPFKRLHREEEFPGIGIGLATVQRIVNRHGGEICAESRPGGGATFCFTLSNQATEARS